MEPPAPIDTVLYVVIIIAPVLSVVVAIIGLRRRAAYKKSGRL